MTRFLACIRRSARLSASCIALVLSARLFAQAPIERQPPPPPAVSAPLPPAPPVAWEVFESKARDFTGTRITVRASPSGVRCILDEVTPSGIRCHQEFRLLPPFIPVLPDRKFDLDRTSVREVWRPDRAASGWLGFGLGFGYGAGVAAANFSNQDPSDRTTSVLVGGLAIGALGAYIGYHAPLIHHVLYRAR